MSEKTSILDLLLKPETPNVRKSLPTARYRVKRLSELLGEDVVFELRALPYGKVSELKESMSEDLSVHIVLSGVVSPDPVSYTHLRAHEDMRRSRMPSSA